VDIYSVEKGYERLCVLEGASSFITHLDWDSTSTYLQLNSGAGERLIFKIVGEQSELADESALPEQLQWASWTGVLGQTV
ncbi:hypothetical protein FHG87_025230, partial [Trinorchestia longiramus]